MSIKKIFEKATEVENLERDAKRLEAAGYDAEPTKFHAQLARVELEELEAQQLRLPEGQ